jgi:predicted nucleotidyltransferase
MLTRKTAIEKVHSFISDLRDMGYAPTQAWVFGSVISGHIHPYSDIDLALWDRNFTGILHLDGEKLKKLLVKFDEIELHPYPSGLSEKENPFIGIIKKTGERII